MTKNEKKKMIDLNMGSDGIQNAKVWIDDCEPLAVYRFKKAIWQIIHIPTGRRLPCFFDRRSWAADAAKAFIDKWDWDWGDLQTHHSNLPSNHINLKELKQMTISHGGWFDLWLNGERINHD